MKLTKATVAGLSLPAGCNEKIYWDDDISLFGVRLRKGGSKGWVFWYRLGGRASPLRKIGLGATSAVSAAEARAEAAKLYAKVRLGQDPASEKAESIVRAGETVESAFRLFLARQAKRLKPRSYAEVERHLLSKPSRCIDSSWRRSTGAPLRSCWWRSGNRLGHLRPIGCAPTFTRFSFGRCARDWPRQIPWPTQTGTKSAARASAF